MHNIVIILIVTIINFTNSKFQPYIDHGGTVVGVAGKGYCILASDTRLSEKYMIHSRNSSRIVKVGCYSTPSHLVC